MTQDLGVEQVYATLQAAISFDNPNRAAAEAQLKTWEEDSSPGFIGDLLKVAAEVQRVPEASRLLAIVVAKNAVGSSWRKTVGSREWSRVPEEEKGFVRTTALAVLAQDPSERVALQVGLLITNIARFDVPRPWASLLPDLVAAATLDSPVPLPAKARALRALKQILSALRGKRFVMEAPSGAGFYDMAELDAIGKQIDADRAQLFALEKGLLFPLRSQWEANFSALLQRGQGWEAHGALAAAGLSALRELLHVLQDLKGVEADFGVLMTEGAQAGGTIAAPLFSGPAAPAAYNGGEGSDPYTSLLSKCWERLLQCALVALDRHTVEFAAHLPAWATLCINTGLLGMDAAAVHGIRAKSRVLLTRFVARALLQPLYRRDATQEGLLQLPMMRAAGRDRLQAALPQLQAASDCLDEMLADGDGRCAALVQAVVSKYIVLSPDELSEWEADPEGFARQVDVETSPDADTPRPCGVALLECMLERADEPVATALVALAGALQAQPLTREGVLPREATYRAIGEVFPHLRAKVDFGAWYANELRGLLTSDAGGLEGSVLRARALWLVGVCGEELQPEPWADAYSLAVRHVASADLVVALMAVSAVTALLGNVLEEAQFVSQPEAQQRMFHAAPPGVQLLDGGAGGGAVEAAMSAEFNGHVAAVEGGLDALMSSAFALLPRLGEVESMVRVLQCVSAAVELMGDRVRPHLGTITGALPQVWGVVSARAGEGTGALARLHSALIATLAHLIGKLGAQAMGEPHVAAVLLPLLHHATNLGNPDSETLVEEGLKLWMAVLRSCTALTPALQELLGQRLVPLLRRGQDNVQAFRVMEGYVLHGGQEAVSPILPQLAAALHASINATREAMQPQPGPQPGTVAASALPPERIEEAVAAMSLLALLQRVCDPLPPELEAPVRDAASVVSADYGGGVMRLPARSVGVVEAALEVVYRLIFKQPQAIGAVTGGDMAAQERLVDRWVVLSSSRDVGELFVPALGAVGRVRRHNAAVGLCALLLADVAPGVRELGRAAQALVLGIKAAREQRVFERDQQRLQDLRPADPEHQDQLLLRRLLLARADPLRGVDATDAVRAAAGHVAGWEGQERMLASLEAIDPSYCEQMAALLAGRLAEEDEAAAIQSMQHAALT